MKPKDQVQLEEAYQSVHEAISSRRARESDAKHFKNDQEAPFKFNDVNSFHSDEADEGYDTGPEDVPQYGSTKSSAPKTYHPATVRSFKAFMAKIKEHVEEMPPELLDQAIARLQKAKQAWGK